MSFNHPLIEFDKPVFFPGEEVTGKVSMNVEKDQTARKVEISFTGKTVTAWSPDGKVEKVKRSGAFEKSQEKFLEMKHEVWQPEDEANTFPAGEYEWNFSFELPKQCPPSFEGCYGHIRYSVFVSVDVPKWLDNEAEKAVTVSPSIDLNTIAGAQNDVEFKAEKEMEACGCMPIFNFAPFRRGTVTFTYTTPTLGFVSGADIPLSGIVHNSTNKAIEGLTAKLLQRVIYRQDLSTLNAIKVKNDIDFNAKTVNLQLADSYESVEIPVGDSKPFNFTLQIPPTVATIRSEQFLSVEYFVAVTAEFDSKWCASATADMNILIGNVPFSDPERDGLTSHHFEKGAAAECWTSHMSDEFRPQFPYYGTVKTVEPQ
uniref:Arrestin_C domain-containing protein n=1 Tax=Caenorhabditis japonica TaxID=281687 RepID=A0A8R1DRA5_CAEJA